MSDVEFDEYELVILRWPDTLPDFDEQTLDAIQEQHLAYLASMRRAGHLKLSGPLREQPDERMRGIALYQVGSVELARELAEGDPAIQAGRMVVDVMRFICPKGMAEFHDVPGPGG